MRSRRSFIAALIVGVTFAASAARSNLACPPWFGASASIRI